MTGDMMEAIALKPSEIPIARPCAFMAHQWSMQYSREMATVSKYHSTDDCSLKIMATARVWSVTPNTIVFKYSRSC